MSTILDKEAERASFSLPRDSEINDKVSTIANEENSHGLNRDIEYAGVSRIEALYVVFGTGWKIWLLYISVALIAYAYSLQSNTTYNYTAYATSSFGEHSLLGAISTATTIISSVGRPFIAKIADLTSRPTAYLCSLALYCLGLILMAACQNVNTYAAGSVIFTVGSTGLDLVTTIIIGDATSLQWRGFAQAVYAAPYIINAFISAYIAAAFGVDNWRWGYGMFCIIVPVTMAPALVVLFWADIKAKRIGTISLAAASYTRSEDLAKEGKRSIPEAAIYYFHAIDGFGLVLLGFAWSLILLPFTLSAEATNGWQNPSLIAMETIGWILLISFGAWELWGARYPLMPSRVLNKTFICCIAIDFFYQCGGYIQLLYYSSWVYVIKDWSLRDYTFWTNELGVGLCAFSFVAALLNRYTHQYKYTQLAGIIIRAIGMGLIFWGVGPNATDATLVIATLVVSLGGAFSVIGSQVASQASVPHHDMATAISLLSLWSSLGAAIGQAIASAIWTNMMPANLEYYLAGYANSTEIAEIYGSITIARTQTPEIRAQVIKAYNQTVQYPMYLPAMIIAVIALIPALLTKNFYLGSNQNAVETKKVIARDDIDENQLAGNLDEKDKITVTA
ncbi:hypothetical protein NQZ79_g7636 [Umbelopsis isabellina]|nr:hypothetical protein NQZ79_g7636 [Umbelopsis isabellina]